MRVEVLVPCVNYADFLALTGRATRHLFDSVTVITRPDDISSHKVTSDLGLRSYPTDAWHKDGALFNKAAALNEYLKLLRRDSYDGWILFLDADVLLRRLPANWLDALDQRGLYSAHRRMCESEAHWRAYLDMSVQWSDFPLDIPSVIGGKVWGHLPTSNPAALCGYFQLWHFMNAVGVRQLPESPTAANYDVDFALSFPESLRRYMDNYEVLHLGPAKTNWAGRVSAAWGRHNP